MKYSTPLLTVYGDSSNLIKGECSWGTENWWADREGYRNYTYLQCAATVTCATIGDCHCVAHSKCSDSQPGNRCTSDSDCKLY